MSDTFDVNAYLGPKYRGYSDGFADRMAAVSHTLENNSLSTTALINANAAHTALRVIAEDAVTTAVQKHAELVELVNRYLVASLVTPQDVATRSKLRDELAAFTNLDTAIPLGVPAAGSRWAVASSVYTIRVEAVFTVGNTRYVGAVYDDGHSEMIPLTEWHKWVDKEITE